MCPSPQSRPQERLRLPHPQPCLRQRCRLPCSTCSLAHTMQRRAHNRLGEWWCTRACRWPRHPSISHCVGPRCGTSCQCFRMAAAGCSAALNFHIYNRNEQAPICSAALGAPSPVVSRGSGTSKTPSSCIWVQVALGAGFFAAGAYAVKQLLWPYVWEAYESWRERQGSPPVRPSRPEDANGELSVEASRAVAEAIQVMGVEGKEGDCQEWVLCWALCSPWLASSPCSGVLLGLACERLPGCGRHVAGVWKLLNCFQRSSQACCIPADPRAKLCSSRYSICCPRCFWRPCRTHRTPSPIHTPITCMRAALPPAGPDG